MAQDQIRPLNKILGTLYYKSKYNAGEVTLVTHVDETTSDTIVDRIEINVFSNALYYELAELSFIYFAEYLVSDENEINPRPLSEYGLTSTISGRILGGEHWTDAYIGASNELIKWPFLPKGVPEVYINSSVYNGEQTAVARKFISMLEGEFNPRTYSLLQKVEIVLPLSKKYGNGSPRIWETIVEWIQEDKEASKKLGNEIAKRMGKNQHVPHIVYQEAAGVSNASYIGRFIYEVYSSTHPEPLFEHIPGNLMSISEEHAYQVVSAHMFNHFFNLSQETSTMLQKIYTTVYDLNQLITMVKPDATGLLVNTKQLYPIVEALIRILNTSEQITNRFTHLDEEYAEYDFAKELDTLVPYAILTTSMRTRIINRLIEGTKDSISEFTSNMKDIAFLLNKVKYLLAQMCIKNDVANKVLDIAGDLRDFRKEHAEELKNPTDTMPV